METPQNIIAPLAGKGEVKNAHSHSNSTEAQRQRLLDALRQSPVSTIVARRNLDILMPAARVHELRHRCGQKIDLVWIEQATECGKLHRVGLYILHPDSEVGTRE